MARAFGACQDKARWQVLVHGGAGAVGSFAVQLAHLHGAYVIATVSGQERFLKQLSADQVIGYKATRFEEEVRTWT